MAYTIKSQIEIQVLPKIASYSMTATIFVDVIAKTEPYRLNQQAIVIIDPEHTPSQQTEITYPLNITAHRIEIDVTNPIINTALQFTSDALAIYIDEDRELKTLLNFGDDRQSTILAYRPGLTDTSIQLKLLKEVPSEVTLNDSVFLSREVMQTVIDSLRLRFAPPIDNTPYLRPKNTKISVGSELGASLRNVTFQSMSLQSGSVGITDSLDNISFEDRIFRQWYSYDFNSSELNINFTNYDNFIFYSSAAMRLAAFREKLRQIESLNIQQKQFISSSIFNSSSAGMIYVQDETAKFSVKKEDIIRSFDRYEQYLYFTPSGSNSPYSASFDYVDGGVEYNGIGYWPKSGSTVYAVDSIEATTWFNTQIQIAQRFDEFNENNLINTVPTHIREDDNSQSYITFVSMIGHFFDNIKPYIDQYPQIYSRFLDPNQELSKDLVHEISEAFGFTMPTLNSIYDLSTDVLGTSIDIPRRDYTVETYKRLLHNLPLFAKAKGSRFALNTMLRTLGITPEFLSIKESGTPISGSYKLFEEYSTALDFDRNTVSYVKIPLSASLRPTYKAIQLNCTLPLSQTTTILTADNKWSLNAIPHPKISGLGRFTLVSGSAVGILTNYYPIFGSNLINLTLQNIGGTVSLQGIATDSDTTVFNFKQNSIISLNSAWSSSAYLYVGGSGSAVQGRYDGYVDELRVWGTNLPSEVVENNAFDPGSNAGATYSDAADYLYAQLSFNNVDVTLLQASSSILNDSPYRNISDVPSLETLEVYGVTTASFSRYSRTVKQTVPEIGGLAYVTDKIKIAPPPVFNADSIDSNGNKLLSPVRSIVSLNDKKNQSGKNQILISVSPTEFINQNIVRNIGLENINNILGLPSNFYKDYDTTLEMVKSHYELYYYESVNINQFIRVAASAVSVVNQLMDYFIPTRATVLRGIVIEPTILERPRISPLTAINVYGSKTRKTLHAVGSLSSSRPDYQATFNLSQKITAKETGSIGGSVPTQTAVFDAQENDTAVLTGRYDKLNTWLNIASLNEMDARYNKYEASVTHSSDITTQYDKYQTLIEHETLIESALKQHNVNIEPEWKPLANISNLLGLVTRSIEPIAEIHTYTASMDQIAVVGSDWLFKSASIVNVYETLGTVSYYTASAYDQAFGERGNYSTYIYQHIPFDKVSTDTHSRAPVKEQFIDVGLRDMNKIKYNAVNNGSEGAEPYNRIYTRKLFQYEINYPRLGGNTSLNISSLYEIKPSADLTDYGVRNFFNDPDGIYLFPKTVKAPVYPSPLNQTWNYESQSFDGASVWSYGSRFNINDVVYQNVTANDTILGELTESAAAGNGRWYVFKTRPSYVPSPDGTSYYLGSVPTYIPPSLDKVNWALLKFKPTEIREAKRVIYDLFTVPLSELNNYKTTTVSLDKVFDVTGRYVDSFYLPTVLGNSYITGELTLQNIAALFALQANNSNLRIRLYRTDIARDADISRNILTQPTGSHGVLLDTALTSNQVLQLTNPIPVLVAGLPTPAARIFYTINNLDSTEKAGTILRAFYFALEIEPRIPFGYLSKHYRFFRDNSTATKRRNFEGCKNTVDTTIDGLPPVQVFISEGNTLVVSPTQTNTEIQTGGGGTLGVS